MLRASNVIQVGSGHFERIGTVAEDAHKTGVLIYAGDFPEFVHFW